MSLEQSLRALAEDDAAAQAPAHVDAAVMAAWDERRHRQQHGRGPVLRRLPAVSWAIGAACAAAVLVIMAVTRPGEEIQPVSSPPRQSVKAVEAARRGTPVVDAVAEKIAPPVAERRAVPARARRAPGATRRPEAAYVLVPDPMLDATALTLMRVRMPRSVFSSLGVPIANPDGDGMVDVEVLVGEDGVARSIRRAAAVGWSDLN